MNSPGQKTFAVKGTVLHFVGDPFKQDEVASLEIFEPGLLIIKNGYVSEIGPASTLEPTIPDEIEVIDYENQLILPGFIDTHLHYPQTDIIGSFGKQLLEWLEMYTFPREGMFQDDAYTESVVDFFFEELLRNGTTTAQVMPTIHKQSAEIFFQKAFEKNLRMISGKVMMDRNAPNYLRDTPEQGFEDSADLIERWHHKGRLSYAVTPRFAITSTEEQLKKASELLKLTDGLYLHTHLAENPAEVAMIVDLFPWSKSYLEVYDRFELVTERSTFAHSIHLPDATYLKLGKAKAAVSFCPTSNLFLGSGLFDLEKTKTHGIKAGIGTDVGGGTSFSMLRTLGEAYKVLQLKGQSLSPLKAFYLATLGGAESLNLDTKIGNFQPGKEADFVVLNLDATPLIQRRMEAATTIEQKLFILMTLGDDRSIQSTYIMGDKLYET